MTPRKVLRGLPKNPPLELKPLQPPKLRETPAGLGGGEGSFSPERSPEQRPKATSVGVGDIRRGTRDPSQTSQFPNKFGFTHAKLCLLPGTHQTPAQPVRPDPPQGLIKAGPKVTVPGPPEGRGKGIPVGPRSRRTRQLSGPLAPELTGTPAPTPRPPSRQRPRTRAGTQAERRVQEAGATRTPRDCF